MARGRKKRGHEGGRLTEFAGEVADGFVAHGFTTERYLREVTLPAIERGLERAGRRRRDFEVCCPVFVMTGRDEAAIESSRAMARGQIAFYGSTPSYRPVLELHGWNDLADELHYLSREGRWAEMGDRITDDVPSGDAAPRGSEPAATRPVEPDRSGVVQSPPMDFNLADLFEHAVDNFRDREYLVCDGRRRTYGEMEERANRLAHHLAAHGVGPGDHVGIYALNSIEWVETLWAVFKLRAVWININYRYVEDELRYLFDNADLKALVYQRQFAPRVRGVLVAMPLLRHSIAIEDGSGEDLSGIGSVDYEAALASASPERDFGPRSADDRYILYTGGTTGLPKGVVWRHQDVFYALGGGIDAMTNQRVDRPEAMVERGKAGGELTFLPIAPLMHGATQWAVMGQSFLGNRVVLVGKFDPDHVWDLVEGEKVNSLMITGDAMGRPLVESLGGPARPRDLSSLFLLTSSAATFSGSVKDEFFRAFPNLMMVDAIGSSEGGNNGMVVVQAGQTEMKGGPTVSRLGNTVVLDENGRPVEPGSGAIGKIARAGDIPLEYYKDPEKTAQTFVVYDGVRYVMPGDHALIEADGRITLLGRGSVSINSGGEKIFPEEVEAAVKSHPAVFDCTIVGMPDERWGERVAAVVEFRPDRSASLDEIRDHCRTRVAGYKAPRQLCVVDRIVRSPSGKPDYRWAKQVAVEDSAAGATRL